MAHCYPFPASGGIEPALAELLTDPVLHTLLARDRLSVADVCAVISDWRSKNLRIRAAAA